MLKNLIVLLSVIFFINSSIFACAEKNEDNKSSTTKSAKQVDKVIEEDAEVNK